MTDEMRNAHNDFLTAVVMCDDMEELLRTSTAYVELLRQRIRELEASDDDS